LNLGNGFLGDEQQAADFFLRGDGEIGKDSEVGDALIFDRGMMAMSALPAAEVVGALRGDGEREIVLALKGAWVETPDQGGGVEVLNDGDAKFRHKSLSNEEIRV